MIGGTAVLSREFTLQVLTRDVMAELAGRRCYQVAPARRFVASRQRRLRRDLRRGGTDGWPAANRSIWAVGAMRSNWVCSSRTMPSIWSASLARWLLGSRLEPGVRLAPLVPVHREDHACLASASSKPGRWNPVRKSSNARPLCAGQDRPPRQRAPLTGRMGSTQAGPDT